MSDGTDGNGDSTDEIHGDSEYRASVYVPVDYDRLSVAEEGPDRPDGGRGGRFRDLDLPKVPRPSRIVGPSAIMLGASLGSGETLFWPSLVASNGWTLYWAFVVGVLTQFVVNTEIQRWTLATGESVFRAFDRVHPGWPIVLLLGGFASLGWPGWAASAARVGGAGLGLGTVRLAGAALPGWRVLGIGLMAGIWLTYQLTPLMYNVVERVQIVLVGLSTLAAIALFALVRPVGELAGVPAGLAAVGTLPPQEELAVFLGGLAYAGAGGYLNLSQSLWVREKGYGMGRYQGRIKNPLVGDAPETVHRDGFSFEPTETNLRRWRGWWRVAQLEHFLTFVAGLVVVATVLMAVAAGVGGDAGGSALDMWLVTVAPRLSAVGGALVYVVLFLALLTTEYAIVESFVRNSSDVVYEAYGRRAGWSLPRLFWWLLTVFVLWGIVILSLPVRIEDPFSLLIVAGATSGLLMWPYILLTTLVNVVRLPEHLQPGWSRLAAMWWAGGFFGSLGIVLIGSTLADAGLPAFHTSVAVVGSGPGGYLLWAVWGFLQGYVVVRSARAKRAAAGTVEGAATARGRFP